MQGEITLKQYRKNNVLKTLLRRFFFLFLYVCYQFVLLDKYTIASFAIGFSFGHIGGRYL